MHIRIPAPVKEEITLRNWLNNWKSKRAHGIEAELKASRPEPSKQLVNSIVGRVRPRPVVHSRTRLGVAGVLTAAMVAVVGATGGFSYAATNIAHATTSAAHSFGVGTPTVEHRNASGPSSADAQYGAAPTITSFSPANGAVGSSVTVTGTNFSGINQITAVNLNGGPDVPSYSVTSSTSLSFTVPSGATTGVIQVTNASGSATSSTSFVVQAAPSITSFAPNQGAAGTPVTITGTGFTGTTSVKFGTKAAVFNVDSSSQISATAPTGVVTGAISVTNGAGTATSTDSFMVLPLPTITSFSPSSGSATAPTSVTVTGKNFTGATSVSFNGVPQSSVSVNGAGTAVTAAVPDGASSGPISVTTAAGTGTSKTSFTIQSVPSIGFFSPEIGKAGTLITINGSGFTGANEIDFTGAAAVTRFTVTGDAKITVAVPADAQTGPIAVLNDAGTSGPSGDNFVMSVLPTITSFTPGDGGPGTDVTITGTNLDSTTGVKFGGIAAHDFSASTDGTTLDVIVPVGAKAGAITVTNPSGTATSATSFVIDPAPVVTSFLPATGQPGDTVTIRGTNFTAGSDVFFNGTEADSVDTSGAPTQITAVVPSGVDSFDTIGPITVTSSTGSGDSKANFTILQAPVYEFFSPDNGKIGTKLSIFGAGFTGTTSVSFNGAAAAFKVVSDFQITTAVPNGASTGAVTITNAVGSTNSSDDFTVYLMPTIATSGAFTPNHGPANADHQTDVDIAGTNFVEGLTTVKFNGKVSPIVVFNSPTSITATTPVGAATGKVSVTNPAGTATSKESFTVDAPPTVTSFKPATGTVGMSVTITGKGFAGANSLDFNGASVDSADFTVNGTGTTITVNVPGGATIGPVTVTNDTIGSGTSKTNFVPILIPSIDSFSPIQGKSGTSMTIHGSHFSGSTLVTFAGTAKNTAKPAVKSDTLITVSVPVGAITGAISVTDPAGTGDSGNDSFTVIQKPTITSFTPGHGPSNTLQGTPVTITGTNLTGVTSVKFGSKATPISAGAISSDGTTIDVASPAGATTGKIQVTNVAGTATSSQTFTVTPAPSITSFSPTKGLEGATVTINGKNFAGTLSVSFNGTDAPGFTVVSPTKITVAVPTGASNGPILVAEDTLGGDPSKTSFTVIATPSIHAFTSSAKVGATITILGTHFSGTTQVAFNGLKSSFRVISDTKITAVVPKGATTGSVRVTNPAGFDTSGTNFNVAH